MFVNIKRLCMLFRRTSSRNGSSSRAASNVDPNEFLGCKLIDHHFAVGDNNRLRNAFSDQILFIAEVGANLKRFF